MNKPLKTVLWIAGGVGAVLVARYAFYAYKSPSFNVDRSNASAPVITISGLKTPIVDSDTTMGTHGSGIRGGWEYDIYNSSTNPRQRVIVFRNLFHKSTYEQSLYDF